jgi:isopenicillin N synthase-like dioxygenase
MLIRLQQAAGAASARKKKKRGYTVSSSGYAATDTSWEKDAASSSALTVTQMEAEPQKNSPCVRRAPAPVRVGGWRKASTIFLHGRRCTASPLRGFAFCKHYTATPPAANFTA